MGRTQRIGYSWHVRNKDNVARVRRDEAKALEEEREVAKRRALAEQEARIHVLREKAQAVKSAKKESQWDLPQEPTIAGDDDSGNNSDVQEHPKYSPLNTAFPSDKHINLFEDFEHKKKSQGANEDYAKEKKKAQEDYEKKIGYLTYLGQSASEIAKDKPWYETISRRDKDDDAVRTAYNQQETMRAADPLLSMKGYLDKKKHAEDVFYGRAKNVSLDIDNKDTGRKKRKADDACNQKLVSVPATSQDIAIDSTHDRTNKRHKHKRSSEKKKSKKHKKSKNSSPTRPAEMKGPTIEELRAERFQREAAERQRSIDLVTRLHRGSSTPARSIIDERSLKYNTVYMPKR